MHKSKHIYEDFTTAWQMVLSGTEYVSNNKIVATGLLAPLSAFFGSAKIMLKYMYLEQWSHFISFKSKNISFISSTVCLDHAGITSFAAGLFAFEWFTFFKAVEQIN